MHTRDGQYVATLMLAAGLGCIDERFEDEARDIDRYAARAAHRDAQAQTRDVEPGSADVWGGLQAVGMVKFKS